MSVAVRTAVRIQDQDDAPSLGAGQDGYALTWDNATGAFVATALSAGVTDHGALTGLSDDDHTGYALLAGRSGGQTLYGGTDANDDITIHGTSNATRTTSYVLLQPTAGNVGIGTSAPTTVLDVAGNITLSANVSAVVDTEIAAIQFKNAANVVGKIAIVTSDTTQDDGNMVISLMNNGTFAEKLRIPRTGIISLASQLNFVDDTTAISQTSSGLMRIAARGSLEFYSSLTSRTYAYFTRDSGNHISGYDALTNTVATTLSLRHNTSGAPAAGYGSALEFLLETSTTENISAARVQALWYEATHATRKADLVLTAYDTSEREGLRIRGAGSAAAIGFLGATPQAQIAHVADPAGGGTVDAEARTAINSILSTLELLGFHATS